MNNDRVEVIKLPATTNSNGSFNNKETTGIHVICEPIKFKFKKIILDKPWGYENINSSSFSDADADDAPLNLSLKSTSEPKTSNENIQDLIIDKNLGKSADSASVNNLSNLQNLTAGIGLIAGDGKGEKLEMA